MKKVFFIMLVAVLGIATANAQFEKGGKTLSGKLTGLDFGITSWDGVDDSYMKVDFGVDGSYFVIDKLAVTAGIGLVAASLGDWDDNSFNFSIGARYYVWDALFVGLAYQGEKSKGADLLSFGKAQVGYTYYLSDKVFFEPALNFEMGFGDTNKVTQFGLSIGIGVNF